MIRSFVIGAALAVSGFCAAQAATVSPSTSFIGDVCDLGGNLGDCDTLIQDGDPGVFSLTLGGLAPDPISDGTISIFIAGADLFTSLGANDANKNFALSLDGVSFGVLFDADTADEGAINAELAAAVFDSSEAAAGAVDSVDLEFTISQADFAPLIADGSITALFDFSGSSNVTTFQDVTFGVSYQTATVPAPAPFLMLIAGLIGLGAMRRRTI